MRIDATINPATAGVQHFFSLVKGKAEWKVAVSETGFYATYEQMFGYPFAFTIEPLVPEGLTQPRVYSAIRSRRHLAVYLRTSLGLWNWQHLGRAGLCAAWAGGGLRLLRKRCLGFGSGGWAGS